MSTFPTFTEATSLALHTVAVLAGEPGRCRQTRELATLLGASEHHLAKVLQRLTKGGLVRSLRGPHGGFMLTETAGEATLLEVYECLEGPFPTNTCMLGDAVCRGEGCVLGGLLAVVSQQIHDHLAGTRLAQLKQITWRNPDE